MNDSKVYNICEVSTGGTGKVTKMLLRLSGLNFMLVGTTAHHAEAIDNAALELPLILMVGNETMGLNRAYKALCDRLCTIPMDNNANESSFNVSCAASIAMYEVTRQRRMYEIRDINTGENI